MTTARATLVAAPRADLLSWITTTDHKRIGILYLTTDLVYFGVAGLLGLRSAPNWRGPRTISLTPTHTLSFLRCTEPR